MNVTELSDLTHFVYPFCTCMWSTHTGLHTYVTYVTLCYRMLPSVINVTHFVCGLHTQACIYMLPMLPSVIGCYRVLSMLPACMRSTHTGLHTYVTGCYRVLSMLPTTCMYVVYTHRPAYICYQCYPVLSDVTECYQCYPLCMRSTHQCCFSLDWKFQLQFSYSMQYLPEYQFSLN